MRWNVPLRSSLRLACDETNTVTRTGERVAPPPEDPTTAGAAVTAAVQSERRALARELHDGAVQSLWSLGAELQQLDAALDSASPALRARLRTLRETWSQAYEELRQTIAQLHDSKPLGEPLIPALERALARLEHDMRVEVHLSLSGVAADAPEPSLGLDRAREAQLVRIGQAALANVRRHSAARAVWVELGVAPDGITLTVTDDGVGFEPGRLGRRATDHFGLTMMRERLDALGGRLDLASAKGQGTRLSVWVPRDGAGVAVESIC